MKLIDHLGSAKQYIFRFEYLQDFSATDAKSFEYWQKNGNIDEQSVKEWWDFLEGFHKQGVVTKRVRRIVRPMNEYTRFELEVHKKTAKRGDKIRTIADDVYQTLDISFKDFWLIDDTTVIDMNYDDSGRYLGFSVNPRVGEYIKAKDLLWRHALPIEDAINVKLL